MITSSLRLLADVSVALLIEAGGRVHVGSGLLVRLDDEERGEPRIVVATAGHNLEGVAGPRAVRVVPRGRYRADPLRVLALGLPPRGGLDIAWIEVDALDVLRRGLEPLHWSYLRSRVDTDRELTVYGYPACHLHGTVHQGTRFDLLAASLAVSSIACELRPNDIAVRWSRAECFHPRGLSGCGIWAHMAGSPRPVALARAWHAGRGVLYCTPIGAWLDWAAATPLRRRIQP